MNGRGDVDEKAPAPGTILKRRRLELARCDILRQLQLARSDAHKEMLGRALAALEQELKELPPATD